MDELSQRPKDREQTILVRRLMEKQKQINAAARQMAHEIIDEVLPEHVYQVARNWVETAAEYARNEEYWWKRCQEVEMYLSWLVDIECEDENI